MPSFQGLASAAIPEESEAESSIQRLEDGRLSLRLAQTEDLTSRKEVSSGRGNSELCFEILINNFLQKLVKFIKIFEQEETFEILY